MVAWFRTVAMKVGDGEIVLFNSRAEGIYLMGWVWGLERKTRMTLRLFSGLSNCKDVVAITEIGKIQEY